MKYRNISPHAEDLDDGRVIDPGAFVILQDKAAEQPRASTLIADGKLIAVAEPKKKGENQ